MKGFPLNGRWTCHKCKINKPVSDFNKDRSNRNGHQGTCRECQRKRLREIVRDPVLAARKREQNARYRERDREKLRPIWVQKQTKRQKEGKIDKVKLRCRMILQGAIRYGRIFRPKCCAGCGKECHAHAHHENYSKPFEVLWLCPTCHADVHKPLEFPRFTAIGRELKLVALNGI